MCSTADGVKKHKKQTTSLSYTDIFQGLSYRHNKCQFCFFKKILLLKGKNDSDIYIKMSHLMTLKSILIQAFKF